MSDYREALTAILTDGTPDQCVGCHTAFLNADHLADQVVEGALTKDEAASKLKEDLDQNCRYGRAAVRAAGGGRIIRTECMYGSIPSLAGMESCPARLMNWDKLKSVGLIYPPPEST
jgi:hypothetical protein